MMSALCAHTGLRIEECECADRDPTSPYYVLMHSESESERLEARARIDALERLTRLARPMAPRCDNLPHCTWGQAVAHSHRGLDQVTNSGLRPSDHRRSKAQMPTPLEATTTNLIDCLVQLSTPGIDEVIQQYKDGLITLGELLAHSGYAWDAANPHQHQ